MHITVTTLPGYSVEEKRMLARRLKEATANLLGMMPCTVSVSVKDLPYRQWDDFIRDVPDDEIIIPEDMYSKRHLF